MGTSRLILGRLGQKAKKMRVRNETLHDFDYCTIMMLDDGFCLTAEEVPGAVDDFGVR